MLEPFITPSLFEVFDDVPVDEYHYTKSLGKDEALSRLSNHWSTFITEDDFSTIAGYGFNLVRIPIGYWAFQLLDDDPYVQGQVEYLDKAIGWARDAGLKVWIDLHGHPGSQNGFDNSGLRDTYEWTGDNVTLSLKVIAEIAEKYGQSDYDDVVAGIELVNEPLYSVYPLDDIKSVYTQGYDIVRNVSRTTPVVIHDAFQDLHYWDGFLSIPDSWNVVLDHHHYQVFSVGELQRSIDDHVSTACSLGSSSDESLWAITGEWSAALTDCTKWLNGAGRGARYDATYDNSDYIGSCDNINDISSWDDTKKADTRKYIEAQLDAYEQQRGWIFWNFRTENALEWSAESLIANNLFPQPLTDRTYSNQCGF